MGALAVIGNIGLTLNLMSLTGLVIVLGMVVDDAIVVSERIVTKRGQGLPAIEASVEGTTEMARPVTAAALTTLLAFMPLMAMGGLPAKLIWQVPMVVVLALLFSLLESFCVLPAHMSTLKTVEQAGKRPFVLRMEAIYRVVLEFAMHHRWLVIGASFGMLVTIIAVIRPLVPLVLFPQDDARSLFLKVSAPVGTPLEQTEAIVTNLQQQIQHLTAVDLNAVTARIGHKDDQGADKERGESENEALVTAIFKDLGREHTNAEWIQILKRELQAPDNVDLVFESEYIGPPTDQPVTLHLTSNDDATRRSAALQIAAYLRSIPGLTEIDVDERPGTPQLDLNLNYEKLARLGLDAGDVALTLQAAFFGIEASEHRDMDDTTELRVMFDPASRGDLQALLETPVRTPGGDLVHLRDVVNPIEVPAVNRLFHRNGHRAATVRASFTPDSGLSALAFAERLETELLPLFADVPGLEIEIGGEAERTQETTGELGQAALLVVLGIGLVIWILLGSFIEAVFVLTVIPFAVAGVILTFFLHGMPLSMMAMMGAIGLAGVVVNASIVMVDSIHRTLSMDRGGREERELVLDAIVERLRPIVVTTLTTLGGVFPTAYGIGGYDTIVSPMSLAIGWGLTFSTMVTLVLVPVLYSVAHDLRSKLANRGRAEELPVVSD